MYYKDPQNNIHSLESVEFEHFLPTGSIQITHDEALKIAAYKINQPTYRELRSAAYPPATDYLDSVVNGDSALRQKYINDCLAVKALYPKQV